MGGGPQRDQEQESDVWEEEERAADLFRWGVFLPPFECSESARGWDGREHQQGRQVVDPRPQGLVASVLFVHLFCVSPPSILTRVKSPVKVAAPRGGGGSLQGLLAFQQGLLPPGLPLT